MNKVFLIGRLGQDPVLRKVSEDMNVCSFSIATDTNTKDKTATQWHRIVCFNKLAEICSAYLNKGSMCLVEGKISSRKYTDKQGQEKTTFEIIASNVQFLSPKGSKSEAQIINDDIDL